MLKCWECGYGLQVILIEGFWAVVSKVIERRKQKCFALFCPFCVQKIQSNWFFFLLFTVSHSVLMKLTLYHRCFYISRFFFFFSCYCPSVCHLADGLQTLAALPLLQPCFFNPTHLVLKMREGRLPLCLSVLSEFHTFEKKNIFLTHTSPVDSAHYSVLKQQMTGGMRLFCSRQVIAGLITWNTGTAEVVYFRPSGSSCGYQRCHVW